MRQGFFWLTATHALIGAALTACTVPNPNYRRPHSDASVDAAPIDAPSNGASRRVTAHWTLRTLGSIAPLSCPPGYDTAALYSQQVDANGNHIGQPIIDMFRCNELTGISSPLLPATYSSWVEITNSTKTATYADSLPTLVDLTHVDQSFETAIYTDAGYFEIHWSLADATTGLALECNKVRNLASIGILSTLISTTTAFDDRYTCEDHGAISGALPTGSYSIVVDALNSANQALGNSAQINGALIAGPNKVTQLAPVKLPIDAP